MFNLVNQKIINFDFKCDKSYHRSFNYFINKRYKIYISSFNAINKKFIIKIDIHFCYQYRNFYIKLFINNFDYLYNIILLNRIIIYVLYKVYAIVTLSFMSFYKNCKIQV